MPLLNDVQYGEYLSRQGAAQQGATLADAANAPSFQRSSTLGQQFGAAFRQENLFYNFTSLLTRSSFPPQDGFDPRPNLGRHEQFVREFPELLEARSPAELSSIKIRIDEEANDREILAGIGLLRSLAVYLPAGLLSPENFIPIGTAARAAGLVGKVAGRSAIRTIARTGTEAALTQLAAEAALQPLQGFRTAEEGFANVLSAGLLGSVLGGAGAGLGASRRAALTAVIGAESFSDAAAKAEKALEFSIQSGKYDEIYAMTRTPDVDVRISGDVADQYHKSLLEDIGEFHPKLARLLRLENSAGKWVAKAMFLNPSQRTARGKVQETRLFQSILAGQFLRTDDPAKGISMDAHTQIARHALIRLQNQMDRAYDDAGPTGLTRDEAWNAAGFAARRGDAVGDVQSMDLFANPLDPFEKVKASPAAVALVNSMAGLNRQFLDTIKRTGDKGGAYAGSTPAQKQAASGIARLLDRSHLPRMVDQDKFDLNRPAARELLRRGLEHRTETVLPEFIEELAELKEIAARDPESAPFLKDEILEYEKWIRDLTPEDEFRNLVESIEENYRNPFNSRSTQNHLAARVLDIDEVFLEPILIHDLRVIQNRLVRSELPDLLLSDNMNMRFGGQQNHLATIGKTIDDLSDRVDKAIQEGVGPTTEARLLVNAMEDALDDADVLTLGQTLRLSRSLEKLGLGRNIQDGLDTIDLHARTRKGERAKERKIRDQLAELEALAVKVAPGELDPRVALRLELEESRAINAAATGQLNRIATRLGDQVGASARSGALPGAELRFSSNRLSLKGATGDDVALRLGTLMRLTHKRVTDARRYTFALNVDAEHAKRAIERGFRRDQGQPGSGIHANPRIAGEQMKREQKDVETMILRLRHRHGVDQNPEFAKFGKRLRDLNYTSQMGSVLLASTPDVMMAIATAGLVPYAQALAKFMRGEFSTPGNKGYAAEIAYAAEMGTGAGRHQSIAGVDDEVVPGFTSSLDRSLDKVTAFATKASLIDRWNYMNKRIAYHAIESRVARTILAIDNGSRVKSADRNLLELFGIDPADHKAFAGALKKHGETDKVLSFDFHLPNTHAWDSRLRTAWSGAIWNGVGMTILTPGIGNLPAAATANPFMRMLFQYRSFSFAATDKFLIPGIQRLADSRVIGDPGPAITMLGLTGTGMFIHALYDYLKGRDPFQDTENEPWLRRMIIEGVDRGGGFGIMSEITSSIGKSLGISGLPQGRFRSRNQFDAFLGPSFGRLKDTYDITQSLSRGEFTKGDAARLRRQIPLQNNLVLRTILDVGPNLKNAGSRRYFRDFLKAEQQFFPEETK